MAQQKRGRGWHGDSAGHARAGRKGGLARARKNRQETTAQSESTSSRNE
jgi:hypothetical protein